MRGCEYGNKGEHRVYFETLKAKVSAIVPEKGPQKLRTSPFAGTNWAIERECPQKLTVTPGKLNYQAKHTRKALTALTT